VGKAAWTKPLNYNNAAGRLRLAARKSTVRITNHANLPAPLVRAITLDPYDASSVDYSTTTLIKPPRIVALERRHAAELEEDAADRIWALMGQLGHLVLERAGMGELAEKRFTAQRLGKKIGGQVDLWCNDTLLDYKFCSIWTAKDGVKPEWEQQMNINALLCRENGVPVRAAQIIAIYRDWSVGAARREADYPKTQVQVFDVPIWSPERQESYVADRISRHIRAAVELPECTPLERWARPAVWALMKEGNKRAIRLHNSFQAAQDACLINPKYYVEHRPGVQTRCEMYCAVSEFCSQWEALKKQANELQSKG
jgi:hypothetical protein